MRGTNWGKQLQVVTESGFFSLKVPSNSPLVEENPRMRSILKTDTPIACKRSHEAEAP